MDISLIGFLGLEASGRRAAGLAGLFSQFILLTSLMHVNPPEAEIKPQRIQNDVLGGFASSVYAL
jgi:hypothetical protein